MLPRRFPAMTFQRETKAARRAEQTASALAARACARSRKKAVGQSSSGLLFRQRKPRGGSAAASFEACVAAAGR